MGGEKEEKGMEKGRGVCPMWRGAGLEEAPSDNWARIKNLHLMLEQPAGFQSNSSWFLFSGFHQRSDCRF